MKYATIFLCLVLLIGCHSSKKAMKSNEETYKPILKTQKRKHLNTKHKNLILASIVQNIQLYTESCEKRKEIKPQFNKVIFITISGKNPSQNLLNSINKTFDSNGRFLAAQSGVSVFRQGLLTGYKDLQENKEGYLISVSVKNSGRLTAFVDLHESRASLGGVYKTYRLKKTDRKWKVIGCKVTGYN